jgi:murein DD-endopeptidase MepM/ murein hydrolase activator NlpD
LGNGNIRLIFPLSIPAPISSIFGWRVHPITGDRRFHSGTDLAAPLGTPVLAAYAGQVAIADFLGGYGLAITLQHNKNTQETLYGHLSELFVKPGDWVKQGDVIGRVGSTGNSTGPHLHFEFRQLTSDGWIALDAGQQLEYALAQLIKAMQVAQKSHSAAS